MTTGLATADLTAQLKVVKINGRIYDGNGGPFKAGTVYWIKSDGSGCCGHVPVGKTLTIQPGAIVKFDRNSISVAGQLVAKGATFTSLYDDAVGGDTNGDGGKTKPFKGAWRNIEFGGPAGSLIEDCVFRYGGSGKAGTLHMRNLAGVVVRRTRILDGGGPGIEAEQNYGTLENSEIKDCEGIAVNNWPFSALQNLSNNKASSNKGGDYVRITVRSNPVWPGKKITMEQKQTMNSNDVFMLDTKPSRISRVLKNNQLVITAGCILKFTKLSVMGVFGDLQTRGTAARPVIFTSFQDDVGGDTNKDGNATTPKRGDWVGVHFTTGSNKSVLEHTIVRYAGTKTRGVVDVSSSTPTFRSCTFTESISHGATVVNNLGSTPGFEDCTFTKNAGKAAQGMGWGAVAKSSGCKASLNTVGDYFEVWGGALQSNEQYDIRPDSYPGAAVVLAGRTDFRTSSRLSFHEGVILKGTPAGSFSVGDGSLHFFGTAKKPIVATSLQDDAIGGDTNNDGNATTPKPGDWGGVHFARGTGRMHNTLLRYAGNRSAAVSTGTSGRFVTLDAVRVEMCGQDGIHLWAYRGTLNNLVVYKAARHGITMALGTGDLLHATVIGCGGYGIGVGGGYKGTVWNSISRNNTGGNTSGLSDKNFKNSNGAFAGKSGNINTDPKFVNAATGDLHLAANSPCLGRGNRPAALVCAKDHEEFSRVLDHALNGSAQPDMGAYERYVYSMTVTGEPVLGQTMTFQINGPAGAGKIFVGFLNGTAFLDPWGVALLGTFPLVQIGAAPVPTKTNLAIPNLQFLLGLKLGVQGLAIATSKAPFGGVTDLYRMEIR